MFEKLSPCPFCGNENPKVEKFRDGANKRVTITCKSYDHCIEVTGDSYGIAADIWNCGSKSYTPDREVFNVMSNLKCSVPDWLILKIQAELDKGIDLSHYGMGRRDAFKEVMEMIHNA